ncbi:MAG: sugar ABC transporter ATP-binding protein [Christensenella sp.]
MNILEMKNITKTFPGVLALDHANLSIEKGEVHAFLGENGSGKSTLTKILYGIYRKDEGQIFIEGKEVKIDNTDDAIALGIGIIFQEFNLVNTLSVAENIFLGRLHRTKAGMVDWKRINRESKQLLGRLEFDLDPSTLVEDLSVAEKQMVEIAKALSMNARILFMDEPSATLTDKELAKLFEIIEKLKSEEVTIVYISHRLEEVFKICDRATIIRDGVIIDTLNVADTTKNELIQKMVGRDITMEFPKRDYVAKGTLMEVKHLSRKGKLHDISFTLKKGEILGIAGLVGAGRTELMRAVFGADRKDAGEIYLNGQKVSVKSTVAAKRHGMALVPEDRKAQGLLLNFSVMLNTTLTNLKKVLSGGILSTKKEKAAAAEYIDKLKIKTPSAAQEVVFLSGGNQQKVVLAKWLYSNAELLIFDEPTRGIDVGAKYEIYVLMNDLVKQGKSIVMISSEIPEIIAMSDRVLVMHDGMIKAELSKDDVTPEKILGSAIG